MCAGEVCCATTCVHGQDFCVCICACTHVWQGATSDLHERRCLTKPSALCSLAVGQVPFHGEHGKPHVPTTLQTLKTTASCGLFWALCAVQHSVVGMPHQSCLRCGACAGGTAQTWSSSAANPMVHFSLGAPTPRTVEPQKTPS